MVNEKEPMNKRIELVNTILECLTNHSVSHPWDLFTIRAREACEHLLLMEKVEESQKDKVIDPVAPRFVKCVDNSEYENMLTVGKTYEVYFTGYIEGEKHLWVLKDDESGLFGFRPHRFEGVVGSWFV